VRVALVALFAFMVEIGVTLGLLAALSRARVNAPAALPRRKANGA
jgi:hypothetical protein